MLRTIWSGCKRAAFVGASPFLSLLQRFSTSKQRHWALFICFVGLALVPYLLRFFWTGTASALFQAVWGTALFFAALSVAFVYFLVDRDLENLANGFVYRPSPNEAVSDSDDKPVARYLAWEGELALGSLLIACLGMSLGFTLLSQGLYRGGFASWYTAQGQGLAFWNWYLYTVLSVFRSVDIFDTISTYGWSVPVIKHAAWPAATIVFLFKATFDVMLLSQLRSWWQRSSTIKQAVRGLRHYQTSQKASETLVRMGASSVPLLLEVLASASEDEARIHAAEALKTLDARDATPLFLRALTNDPAYSVRIIAAELLANWQVKEAIPALIERVEKDPHDEVRQKAISALWRLEGQEAVPVILHALEHDMSEAVRSNALVALRNMDVKEAIPLIIQLLGDDDEEDVRSDAAEALSSLEAKESIVPLIRAVELDQSYRVRRNAVKSLRKLQAKEAGTVLTNVVQNDTSARVRREAAETLRDLNIQDATSALLTALEHDPDVYVRQIAAETLGEWYVKEAIPLLQQTIEEDEKVRAEAARALAAIEDHE